MKTPTIWKKLIINQQKIITTPEIQKLGKQINKDEWRSIDYLQRHGYIYRILRGIFYIRDPEERERDFFKASVYEMVAMALKVKGIKNWYFGLETALKFNEMTHEYFTINYVITDSFRTTKVINILDFKFQFIKWSKKRFKFGLKKVNGLRFTDKEKTALDMAYKNYIKNRNKANILSPIKEYILTIDKQKLSDYLKHYPKTFRKTVGGQL